MLQFIIIFLGDFDSLKYYASRKLNSFWDDL